MNFTLIWNNVQNSSRDGAAVCAALDFQTLRDAYGATLIYPAGREKLDALGAIDLALWDIKGKAPGVTLDVMPLRLAAEITERERPIPLFHGPDGS